MSNTINIKELNQHLDTLDGRTGDIKDELYRHFMSKDEVTGDVEGRSYSLTSGYNKIIGQLDVDRHQYVTLSLFSSPTKRSKTTLKAASGLYVDLDDSLFGDKIALDLINKTLTRARIPEPTMVIHTGGGWHVYWLFNSLYYINNREDIARYESVVWDIITSLSIIGADPKSKDAGRLLRLAGTYNKKEKYETSPAVMIMVSNDIYYDIDDFNGLHVVKKLPTEYDLPVKKEVKKSILTQDEPTAIKRSSNQPQVINKPLTRPEDFPTDLIPEIIVDAQIELERRNKSARYMEEINQEVIDDLLINYIGLPRNRFIFNDGSVGQYIQEGNRNHFLWALSRRGVPYKHLDIINRTMLLPSLSHKEFMNAVNVWRTMGGVPTIKAMISDLGLSLEEQSVMMTLRVDYEKLLDNHEKTVRTRIDQVTTESNRQYIQASKGKSAKVLSEELDISLSSVYNHKKKKGGEPRMTRDERIQELSNIRRDVERTGRVAIAELLEDYQLAGEVLDRIIKNQTLIYNLRVPLTPEQREEIKERAESLASKVSFILSQIEAYESFIVDESEYFKSGKIKKTVLLDKLNVLKDSTRLITV